MRTTEMQAKRSVAGARLRRAVVVAMVAVVGAASVAATHEARAETEEEVLGRAKVKTRFPGHSFTPRLGVNVSQFNDGTTNTIQAAPSIGFGYWPVDRLELNLNFTVGVPEPYWLLPAVGLQWVFWEHEYFAPYLRFSYGYGIGFSGLENWHDLLPGAGFYVFLGPVGLRLGGFYGARIFQTGDAYGYWGIEPGIVFSF